MYDGINVEAIHAERTQVQPNLHALCLLFVCIPHTNVHVTQEQRDNIIKRFRTGEIWVLICTDLMARGIDFKGVNMVINYDFPQVNPILSCFHLFTHICK